MNSRDKFLLKKRLAELSAIVREQHKLPKSERSAELQAETKTKIDKINEWFAKPVKKVSKTAAAISKREFLKRFKAELHIGEPDEVIVIDTIEQLEEAWPNIKGRNISLKINESEPSIKKRLLQLSAKFAQEQKRNGFR
ncbi:MAG: hypothetical protein WKF87_06910 [Chryseolinea sp.]